MKKNLLSFLAVKIQLVLVLAIAGAVWLTVMQNQRLYREQFKYLNKTSFIADGEELITRLDDRFEGYAVAIKGMAKLISTLPGTAQSTELEAQLAKRTGYVAIHLFKKTADGKILPVVEAFTKTDPKRFSGKPTEKILSRMSKLVLPWLEDELKKNPRQDRFVKSLTQKLDLPVFAVASSYSEGTDGSVYWGVSILWNDEIKGLLESRDNSTYQQIIMDANSQIFMAVDDEIVKRGGRYDTLAVVSAAKGADGGSIFLASYRDENQREWMGAVHSSDKTHFSALTQITVQEVYRAWDKGLSEVAIIVGCYGAIFLLIGFLVTSDYGKRVGIITESVRQIAAGNLDVGVKVRGSDHVAMLGWTINHMTDRLKKIIVHNLLKTKNEKFHEVAAVTGTWTDMVSKSDQLEGLKITAKIETTGSSCSDFVLRTSGTSGIIYLFIGSGGHAGIKGAMESAMLYSSLVTLMRERERLADDVMPSEILNEMEKILYQTASGAMNANLFVGMLDVYHGTILYANAGNNIPMLMVQNSSSDNRLVGMKLSPKDGFVSLPLDTKYGVLGSDGKAKFDDKSMTIQTGEKIVFYAKSVGDSSRSGVTKLTTSSIASSLVGKAGGSVDEIVQVIIKLGHAENEPQNESDVSLLVAEFSQVAAQQKVELFADVKKAVPPLLPSPSAVNPFSMPVVEAAALQAHVDTEVAVHEVESKEEVDVQFDFMASISGEIPHLPPPPASDISAPSVEKPASSANDPFDFFGGLPAPSEDHSSDAKVTGLEPNEKKVEVPEPKLPEHKVPEHKVPEHKVPEHKVPEHKVPEHKVPEHKVPEHKVPEHKVPEHKVPEHKVPEHKVPEHKVPEHKVPEHKVPEHKVPEHKVPEHKEPEHKVPEHKVPEHKVPEHKKPPIPLSGDSVDSLATNDIAHKKERTGGVPAADYQDASPVSAIKLSTEATEPRVGRIVSQPVAPKVTENVQEAPKKIVLSQLSSDEQMETALVMRSSPTPPPPVKQNKSPAIAVSDVPMSPPSLSPFHGSPKGGHPLPPQQTSEPVGGERITLPPPPPTAKEFEDAYRAMGLTPPVTYQDPFSYIPPMESSQKEESMPVAKLDVTEPFVLSEEVSSSDEFAEVEPAEYHLSLDQVSDDLSGEGIVFTASQTDEKPSEEPVASDSLVQMLSRDFFPTMSHTAVIPSNNLGEGDDGNGKVTFEPLPPKDEDEISGEAPVEESVVVKKKEYSGGSYFDDDDLFIPGQKHNPA